MYTNRRRIGKSLPVPNLLICAFACLSAFRPADATAQDKPRPGAQPPASQPDAQQNPPADVPQDDTERPEPLHQLPSQAGRTPNAQPPPPKPVDTVTELLRRIDPDVVARLAGADVTVEIVGVQIILHGPEEAVKTLELLIRGLDKEAEGGVQKAIEVITVSERDANEIARSLQPSLRAALGRVNQTQDQQLTITALASNILLISALEEDIDFVIETIRKVDEIPDPLGKIELMRFQVKYRKASEVSREVEKIINQINAARGAPKEKSKLQFIPNNANNTITVTARETEREKIQAFIDQIDVEPVPGFGVMKLTVFPLIHSKSSELAKVIQDLLRAPPSSAGASAGSGSRDAVEETLYRLIISKAAPDGQITDLPPIDLQKTIKISSDDGTNSLIVATSEENVLPMAELIRLLDGVPLGAGIAVRLFPLRFATAEALADTLNKMFEDGKKLPEDPGGSAKDAVPAEPRGRALVYNIGIVADARTNTLVVSGRPEQLSLVDEVVAQLDQPATALKFPLRLIPLEFSDATALGETITVLFKQRFEAAQASGADKTALERERLFLSVDLRSNSLIISASEENFNEIMAIVKQLDTKPARLFDQIRILQLQRLSAVDLQTKIEELWARKAALRREAELVEDIPVIAVDERSNSLLIASSIEDFEEIQRLVRTLETQPLIEDTRLFKLEFADATSLAGMLDELFEGIAAQSEKFKAPTIIPDPRSNALVVAATRDTMERVAEVVRRLDVQAGPLTSIFRVYPLRHGSATQLAARIQELFDAQKETGETARTPVVVMAEETSNSLVVSASRDIHAEVVGLIELLDKPSNIARFFRIFPLRLAKAATIAEKLESLFKSQSEGATGRADVTAVQADERTNSLIVWAAPSQMTNIAEIIDRLDTQEPTRELMVKVIQLRQALAEDFAALLRKTLIGEGDAAGEEAVIVSFLEKTEDGREIVRKLLRQDIKIEPDPRTNSLMVMAPADSMTMLESMIRDFDRIRPITSEIRLFPLINSDAKTMVEQLKEIFKTDGGGGTDGAAQSQIVFGTSPTDVEQLASVGQELRFAADTRTNTLIAAGAPVYLTMVEDLVRFLDSQSAENRVSTVYNAKFRPATDLATAVKGFVEQELNILGESDTEESRVRRQERQVSVESVGSEEKGSSSLLVGTSARTYQKTMDLIQSLDRAEPQVMISVLIAEVTLTDNVDLGVELAGQELDFSRNAVVGPNGVIEGSDFDFVGGNALGAVGSGLGFNFTVTGEDFSFLLRALQTDSRLEVLSRPVLMVRNGEEGKITIADKVPVVQSSQVTQGGQINVTPGREEVGIILTATPHISPDGYVTIELSQEISNIGASIQLAQGFSQPIFATREVKTNITVRDGETAIVGGLIQSNDSQSETKVPLLGDIPGLGALFRTTATRNSKTELLVVLTVDVLRTDEDVRQMSVEQRDKFILPDSIRQSPLMEGLRIKPEECGLGPKDSEREHAMSKPAPQPTSPVITPDDRKGVHPEYGPKPKIYGPPINRGGPSNTTSTGVYGPRIARSAPSTDGN